MKEITYSMINTFLSCRKHYEYRYVRRLAPVERPTTLSFGSCVHTGLEFWFKFGILNAALHAMDCYAEDNDMSGDELTKAKALVSRYVEHWSNDKETFDVVEVEYKFKTKLRNPKTNRPSRTNVLTGKVDAIVRMSDGLYIMEHKTTSALDGAYIDRIRIDSQIAIYANAISQVMGEPVCGAIYDILVKPGTRFRVGETQEEFEKRRDELLAKSKTGKTTAKRHERESLESFEERCLESITPESFRREIVRFSPEDLKEHLHEVWSVGKEMNNGLIYRNTGSCTKFNRPCPYLALCAAHGDLCACEGLYETQEPNIELKELAKRNHSRN